MPNEDFEVPLDSEGLNWLRARYTTVNGQVVRFSVQYETVVDGNRQPLVRYDNAHGVPHRDLLSRDGSQAKLWFEEMSPGDAMTMGLQDLKANWQRYRRQLWGDQA